MAHIYEERSMCWPLCGFSETCDTSETNGNAKTIDESSILPKITHKLKVDEVAGLTNSEPWFEKVLSRG